MQRIYDDISDRDLNLVYVDGVFAVKNMYDIHEI